ncbi:MAG: aminopeptidase P family protein [Bacteroidetes bacterium]|nr:aminopeptidase P family protein [Bacteroidota bacterium]
MFARSVYICRRKELKKLVGSGLIFFPGNHDSPFNYPANTYSFRQDSSFLYYFGIDQPEVAGVVDVDENKDYFFGNDIDLDDIIWMGPQPSIAEKGASVGVEHTGSLADLQTLIQNTIRKGRKIHFLPPYKARTLLWMEELLGIRAQAVRQFASVDLIKAVVKQRSVKDKGEIAEIKKAIETAYYMHTTAMLLAQPGVVERKIAGVIEGIALSCGGPVSFPVILTINGQTLHNHYHGNVLKKERMLVIDTGAETEMHYTSDITRTVPVGGKFSKRQKDIYEIVLEANMKAIKAIKPDVPFKKVHLLAAKTIAEGLKGLGLMKGDTDDAVKAGAHALFFPHGLGHMLGLDVHDMEGLGENYVGYDSEISRSDQFGLAFLRMARKLEPGFVLTVEPGIYFIPALVEQWKKENKFEQFINYSKVKQYLDFGGIRIEDDVLVTEKGYRVLGMPIPKTVADIEKVMKGLK